MKAVIEYTLPPLFALAILFGFIEYASAAATAMQVLPGFLSTATTGSAACPSGQTSCWLPYSTTNPLPASTTNGH